MGEVTDTIRDLDIGELITILFNSNYFELLFPFLLAYAILYTVLCNIKLFQHKKGENKGKPVKAVAVVVAAIVSIFGISFELSEGYSVGNLLMMLFPNISAITIGILALYIAGSIFAKDFFGGLFRPDHSAFLFMTGGVIGLGSIIYYTGIAMGFWDQYPITNESYWNMILAIAFLIMGIVFLFIDLVPYGIVLLFVFGTFVYNYGNEGSIFELFVDPIIFIIIIVTFLVSWLSTDSEKKTKLEKDLELAQSSYTKDYGNTTYEPYKNKIRDIRKLSIENQKLKLDELKKRNR